MSFLNDLMSKGADGAADGAKKLKTAVQKSFHSDSFDMYKTNDMQYNVKDSTFRDIYERGNEQTGSPKLFATVMPMLALSVYAFVAVVMIPLIATFGGQHGYFGSLFSIYLNPLSFSCWMHLLMAVAFGWGLYAAIKIFAVKYWESQHADQSDELLKQYKDDSRIQQPEELSENFDIFPDVGGHSHKTNVTAILGHYNFDNAGLKKVTIPLRADGSNEYVDEDGDALNKNVLLYDENDEIARVTKPMIDEKFGEDLWDSAGIPRPAGKNTNYIRNVLRKRYSPDKLMYNPTHKFGKPDVRTVAEWINEDWYMPDYEVQRPAGAYIVDTEPNNTMVLAMTRAGKGNELCVAA